jgi:hypothetical protein
MLLNIHNEESWRIRNKKFSSEWPFKAEANHISLYGLLSYNPVCCNKFAVTCVEYTCLTGMRTKI